MVAMINPTHHDQPYQAILVPASRSSRPGGSTSRTSQIAGVFGPAPRLALHALAALLWTSSASLAACSGGSTSPGPDGQADAAPVLHGDAAVDAMPAQLWRNTRRLQAPEARRGGYFGTGLSVRGDLAVATAPSHGHMYVYQRTGGAWDWDTPTVLTAADVNVPGGFGGTVVVGDGLIAAAARYQYHDSDHRGSVFLYMHIPNSPTPWQQVAELRPSNETASQYFASTLAMDGDVLVATGTQPAQLYVFENTPQGWRETTTLTPAEPTPYRLRFAEAVAVTGDTIFVGVTSDDSTGTDNGAVLVYRKEAEGWVQHQTLYGHQDTQYDQFGSQISASGDTVAIASEQSFYTQALSGRVYMFERGANGDWTRTAVLTSDTGSRNDDRFGASVSLNGDVLMVGSSTDYEVKAYMGAAYIFERTDGQWHETAKLIPYEGGQAYDLTGTSCAVDGDTALMGTYRASDYGDNSGAVYVIERNPAASAPRAR